MVEHVAITGGNGFIASHIIHQLLEADREPPYKVTATVRSLERGNCIADLPHARHRLFLRVANLMEPNSFDFAGQDVVIHTASPVLLDAVKDAKSEIVDPAVSGTLAVLHAAMKAKTVKIFVLTSSLSAVTEGPQFGKVINETEWNTDSTLKGNPYPYSKVCAERAAWNFMESNPHCGFKLFTLLPSVTIGPSLTKSVSWSVGVFRHVLSEMPVRIGMPWPLVDVRDVAAAHIKIFESADRIESGRYLVVNDRTTSIVEVCNWISERHPDIKLPKLAIPKSIAWVASFMRKSGEGLYLRQNLSSSLEPVTGGYIVDNSKLKRALTAFRYRIVEETVEATVQDLIMWGNL